MLLSFQLCWPTGWPVTDHSSPTTRPGGVVLQLGALNESLLRPGDLYLCIKAEPKVHLCAVWRTSASSHPCYRPLDPDQDPLSPISLDMLADELPTLLQNLLVSVEHAICRVPIDQLSSFGQAATNGNGNSAADTADNATPPSTAAKQPVLSPRCSIKRRDVITRNNYRRMSLASTTSTGGQKGTDVTTPALDPTSMPLFCLGGSFPHIDSDEESAEDSQNGNSIETGEL